MRIEEFAEVDGSLLLNSLEKETVVERMPRPSPDDAQLDAQLSFEEALRELEEVVAALESGNVPLEQSIALLRRGLALAEQCDAVLSQAETTLEQLVATPDGELIVQPIDEDESTVD